MNQPSNPEDIEKVAQQTYLLERSIKLNKRRIIMDLVLIAMFIFLVGYVVVNIETAKVLNGDVCRICEAKTGGKCQIQWGDPYANSSIDIPSNVQINFGE